jgi:hypothetical protein
MGKAEGTIEKRQTYQISYKTLVDACTALTKFFGMAPVVGTDKVELGAAAHEMFLAGEVASIGMVLAVVKLKMDQKYGCVLSLQVRATHQDLCQLVLDSLS